MIRKIENILKKRKAKIFSVFLLCSGLAWFISNLSETYVSNATFDLEFYNIPDSLMLAEASKDQVDVRLRAGGFQFLGFNLGNKKVGIDLANVDRSGALYYIPQDVYREEIEGQLPGSMTLLEMDRDTLFFDFYVIGSKKVPVKPQVRVNLAQNYLLDGAMSIVPDTIILTGPTREIDSIYQLRTPQIDLTDLTEDFSREVALEIVPGLEHTSLSSETVVVSGKVSRFSERIFDIPITVTNLPEGAEIKTFPEMVSVLCKARISVLKELDSSDFSVVGDYAEVETSGSRTLNLNLERKPDSIHGAMLLENAVEYVLNRKP